MKRAKTAPRRAYFIHRVKKFILARAREITFYLILTSVILLSGCSAKPEIITRTEYQNVYLPAKCRVELPQKPKFDESKLESAKEIAKYYQEIERLLVECVDE
ncbi:hypothetical protein [Campylobacter sp. RM16188]|uniref:hypothetical protein n=1 Tax=Campylobacter sp. RM16188 TaxID=1705725 RepID=UPI0020A6B95B|nr:hypothetical protein [Campylobacter sp. RM16188]